MNEENLIPTNKLTETERRNLARKAGQASGKARKERKTMREMLNYLLSQDISDSKGNKKKTIEAVLVGQIRQAIKGNTKAATFIRDTIGEKPIDKQEITGKDGKDLITNIEITPVTVINQNKD